VLSAAILPYLREETEAMAEARQSFDVRDFGAKGDGKADDTQAIQRALDAAAETQATVRVPEGVFLCSTLKLPAQVGFVGTPAWRYNKPGGSVLRLGDEKARCLPIWPKRTAPPSPVSVSMGRTWARAFMGSWWTSRSTRRRTRGASSAAKSAGSPATGCD
jgi:hypothetical protein